MAPLAATPFHESRVLPARDLVAHLGACPLCGDVGPRRRIGEVQREPPVALLACARCGGASASHMPTEAALDAYYGSYYDGGDERTTFHDADRFARHLEAHLAPRALPAALRILDFGGGDGSVALALARRLLARGAERVEIALVDPTEAEERAEGPIRLHRLPDLEAAGGGYELALASAILEHLPAAGELLPRLVGALAPGGRLYARTPWVAPLKRLAPGLEMTFPGHVHDLGLPFWSRAVETFGLDARLVRSRPSIVETSLRRSPLRAALAHALKAPARLELLARGPRPAGLVWRLVGGWEVVLERLVAHEGPRSS